MYDEIFHVLAVERDMLLLKPFPDLTPPTVQTRLGPRGLSRVWQTEKHPRARRFPTDDTVKAEVQKWLREQNVSYRQDLENFIVRYGKCPNKFGNYVEKYRTNFQR
jgi:hypothetical protein